MKSKTENLPLRKTLCATCPFRPGSPYQYLADELAASALKEASRICHSTGANNAINHRTGKPPHFCRGARNMQLKVMYAMGIIDAPSDEAWNRQRVKIGMQPTVIADP